MLKSVWFMVVFRGRLGSMEKYIDILGEVYYDNWPMKSISFFRGAEHGLYRDGSLSSLPMINGTQISRIDHADCIWEFPTDFTDDTDLLASVRCVRSACK